MMPVESTEQAFQAGKAFGHFQRLLVGLPTPRLHDTIPDFHHTPKRFAALQQAIAADVAGRAILAKPEIEFALARQSITGVLLDANLPERVTTTTPSSTTSCSMTLPRRDLRD